jgi:ferredoxin
MSVAPRLRVDPIACDGRGLCAEVLPELIRMDDWGFPIIAEGPVPARLRAAAGQAVRVCPRIALRLEPGAR